ncbi:MAG: SprB repeat-containing protein [Saprospiraceae bacterium]
MKFLRCFWACLLMGTTLSAQSPLQITGQKTDVSCYGGFDGAVNISVSGSTPPYIPMVNGSTVEDVNNLSAGIYAVTITDATGVTTTSSYVICQPLPLLISNTIVEPATTGNANGSINISVSGGTPGYTYSWANGFTDQDLFAISAGTYSVTVVDGNGCSTTGSYTVTQGSSSAYIINTNLTQPSCSDDCNGKFVITKNPSTGTFYFSHTNFTTGVSDAVYGTSHVIDNLCVGDSIFYSVKNSDFTTVQSGTFVVGQATHLSGFSIQSDHRFL